MSSAAVGSENARADSASRQLHALLVGGAGFIGSHLVDRLLDDGHRVDAVDDLSRGNLANLADARQLGGSLKIHTVDAASPDFVTLVGLRRPDVIYHLAAVPRGRPTAVELAGAFATTVQVLEAARTHGVAKVVVALPASAIYGRPANRALPVKEGELVPRGVRGVIARATVELLGWHREQDAIEFTALALGNVYGPRQRPDGGVVAALAAAARGEAVASIAGDGRQTRDFVFVDDVVDALARAGTRGSGLVINIGTGEQTAVRDVWERLRRPTSPAPIAGAPDDLPRFALSSVRARIHLGWSAWTPLADGLSQVG